MESVASTNALFVQQKKEWAEIATGFETRNRYSIMDEYYVDQYNATEEKGSTLLRLFLKGARPFTMSITRTLDGKRVMFLERPFRFIFHSMRVFCPPGKQIGSLQMRFSILRRIYSVCDVSGREILRLYGPLLRPWTFRIMQDGKEIGLITKKWSGLLKEGFSDADNFGVQFPQGMDVIQKSLLLAAVILIDFVHFENK